MRSGGTGKSPLTSKKTGPVQSSSNKVGDTLVVYFPFIMQFYTPNNSRDGLWVCYVHDCLLHQILFPPKLANEF